MVPDGVTAEPGTSGVGAVELRRVGPGGSMASDNAFAVALLTLWHRVARAGGAVGFARSVERAELGRAVAVVHDDIKSGRSLAYALTRNRDVIGFALLEPGVATAAHTGVLRWVMVEPGVQGAGHGTTLTDAAVELARATGLERLLVAVRDGDTLDRFFGGFGFTEAGRLTDWFRVGPEGYRDEVLMTLVLTC